MLSDRAMGLHAVANQPVLIAGLHAVGSNDRENISLPGRRRMTSGNIQLGPDPDEVLKALEKAVRSDPRLRKRPAEDVSKDLVQSGYLPEEPDPVLVAEMLGTIEDKEAGGGA